MSILMTFNIDDFIKICLTLGQFHGELHTKAMYYVYICISLRPCQIGILLSVRVRVGFGVPNPKKKTNLSVKFS